MGTADDTHSKLNLNHQIWCLCVWVCVSECVQLPEGRTVFSNSFLASVVSCRIKKYTIWLFSGTHHQIVTILLILSVGCVWACESVWNQDQRSADLVSVSPRWVTLSLVWKWLEGSVPAGHPCSYSLSCDCPASASNTHSQQLQRTHPVTPCTSKTHGQHLCQSNCAQMCLRKSLLMWQL